MAQRPLQTGDVAIEQKPPVDPDTYDGDIVLTTQEMLDKEQNDRLAFMEEPVTIVLAPSTERNAATVYPVWVNGQGAQVLRNGRWGDAIPTAPGWLPIGEQITIRRKVLEVIIRAKIDRIQHDAPEPSVAMPDNSIKRFTSAVHSYSILRDDNPRGHAWATEMMRRNF